MKALFNYAPLLIAATLTGAAVENEAQAFRKFLNQFSEHVIPVTDRIKEGAYVFANDVQDRLNRSEVAHKVIHQTLNPKYLFARP